MSSARYWCRHAWLGGDAVADGVTVEVTDGYITAVTADTHHRDSDTALTGLVLPGLANAHSHAFHRALRSRTQRDRGTFWTWRNLMYQAADRLTPESYYQLARSVYAEMVLAGITCVGEFHYLHHDDGGTPYADPNAMGHALIAAARDAGLRITLLDTCYLSSAVDGSPLADGPQQRFGDHTGLQWAQRVETLHQHYTGDTVVVIGAALHSVRGVPVEHMGAVVDWATAHDAPLHVHSSEQNAEIDQCLAVHGCTPTALLRDHGALGSRTTAVHATHLTDADITDLDTTVTGVCFCPTTERDLGDGLGPATALMNNAGLFSLGSDSHAVIDLFEEARAVELDERLARRERGLFAAADLLTAATANGHQALGFGDAGHLRVGQRADLVAVDLDSIRTAGSPASAETAVFAATAADITDVVIDGRVVVANRRHTTIEQPARDLAHSITVLLDGEPIRSAP
ncbi:MULTISPECIES: formimidoylglutamate deiminase [unclassified Mycolicibacterium]|uniref:formimidoylglutamate deiminase n=1 Tax=unclassified Mycolicibacterium TaxID=2636767 RepID=UPI0012DC6F96|nr:MULTISPECIES: formimidoylglutamate deiminase [unclassified Mycolicibacterium]MUL82978.1 formimidoylglutamate deiminase [Mycolicibacterium sp. CBMA 329]MUL89313.1 formimidoylglutamate deiminase [Mycolicibacterium sp. CBMA 331]MUM02780.1 formimidoylglutamate deiminase [Mycolicibacterium sp. CBMA 334]MUM25700.1 formimidoylglutamate deiminase [Mycolicibacterium sp. CBMA 295]MUM38829.1 formimidoylglutamate deiminase [Mycolicibacterium sp. CBMA 247]